MKDTLRKAIGKHPTHRYEIQYLSTNKAGKPMWRRWGYWQTEAERDRVLKNYEDQGYPIDKPCELVRINGDLYEVDKQLADYIQYQEDTIKQLRASHEKQESDWKKAFYLLRQRLQFAASVEPPET